jgi:hypothetical protein
MEINVPGSSYHVCAKTEFFHPPIWNRKRPVHCLCSGRFCAAKRAVSQRFPKLTEKSLKTGKQSRYRGKCDFRALFRVLPFLAVCRQYPNKQRDNNAWWYH